MGRSAVFLLAAALLAGGCTAGGAEPSPQASPTGDAELWRRDRSEPYPFTTPIPPQAATPIDGTYARSLTPAQGAAPPIPCRRCAPYRLNTGLAVLEFDAGRFQLTHEAADFTSRGHFLVDGNRLVLFNDPNCSHTAGRYRWRVDGGTLRLDVVEDPCPFDLLRARYFSAASWDAASD